MEEKSSTNISSGHQQFNLRWNNHTNNILQVFTEQFANENLVDITLSCEGQFIKAHKMILSACSPYFLELFRFHNTPHPVVIINGMKYSDVKQVIDFMYRGEVKVLEAELDSLLAVAEALQVKGLCTVRNNYEKQEAVETNENCIHNDDNITDNTHIAMPRSPKKRKLSNEDETLPKSEAVSDDESLSNSQIKIEPPEIKDIDQEEKISDPEDASFDPKVVHKPLKTTKSGRPIRPKTYSAIETFISKQSKPPATPNTDTFLKRIPRPPNAFMIFANEWRRKLASEHPKESNKEISVRLGIMWKNLGNDAKDNYYNASRRADEEHKRKYPGYYYSPKEARLRKNMKESFCPNKKKYDAMRFVKLVMTESTESEKWRTEQTDDKDVSKVISNNFDKIIIKEKIKNEKMETNEPAYKQDDENGIEEETIVEDSGAQADETELEEKLEMKTEPNSDINSSTVTQ